jgi:nicotinamidase/pyrazinamidase
VKNTVLDALEEGFQVTVVTDAIRGIDVEPGDSQRAINQMRRAGAAATSSGSLL